MIDPKGSRAGSPAISQKPMWWTALRDSAASNPISPRGVKTHCRISWAGVVHLVGNPCGGWQCMTRQLCLPGWLVKSRAHHDRGGGSRDLLKGRPDGNFLANTVPRPISDPNLGGREKRPRPVTHAGGPYGGSGKSAGCFRALHPASTCQGLIGGLPKSTTDGVFQGPLGKEPTWLGDPEPYPDTDQTGRSDSRQRRSGIGTWGIHNHG